MTVEVRAWIRSTGGASTRGMTPRSAYSSQALELRTAGSREIVQQLLTAGADPNIAAMGGATPLHAAADAGQLEIVLLLLKVQPNILSRDHSCLMLIPDAASTSLRP